MSTLIENSNKASLCLIPALDIRRSIRSIETEIDPSLTEVSTTNGPDGSIIILLCHGFSRLPSIFHPNKEIFLRYPRRCWQLQSIPEP